MQLDGNPNLELFNEPFRFTSVEVASDVVQETTPLRKIPLGPKGNKRFVVNNEANYKAYSRGKQCMYVDDRSAYRKSSQFWLHYTVNEDGSLNLQRDWKREKNGAITTFSDKTVVDTKPYNDRILVVKTTYHHSKNAPLTKRTTEFFKTPSNLAILRTRCLVEYKGIDTNDLTLQPHGNNRKVRFI